MRRNNELLERLAWRPIETAPLNEYVLLYSAEAEEHSQIMICAKFEFQDDPQPPEWTELGSDIRLDVEPSHWMPLPDHPAVKDAE